MQTFRLHANAKVFCLLGRNKVHNLYAIIACPEVLLISFCHLFWCLLVFLKNSMKIIYLMFYTVFMFSSTLGEFVEQVRSNTKGK